MHKFGARSVFFVRDTPRPRSGSMKGLFRFPAATRRDPAVAAWFEAQPAALSSIAQTWFDQMHRCGPDVRELMHDGCPVACVGEIAFGYVNVFTSHVNVGFFQGADLDDPADLLVGEGRRMRHIKLRPDDEPDVTTISNLIEDAYLDVQRRLAGREGAA